KNAPVAYEFTANGAKSHIDPWFARPAGTGLVSGAQHPAAAWLYLDWMLSPDGGQKVLESLGEWGVDTLASATNTQLIPADKVYANQKDWTDKYDALLRGAKKAN